MITTSIKLLLIVAGVGLAATASAQELMVFPNEGQDKAQQEQDEFTCYKWAKDETGFDPMAAPTATAPPPKKEEKKGGMGRGAVRGAALGALIDGSDGAKTGAAVGAAGGHMRRQDQKRKEDKSQEQWEQEQLRIYQENRNRYNRAYAACMEGKNYTVR